MNSNTTVYCGNCGTANNSGFKYCVSCGHGLTGPTETTPRPSRGHPMTGQNSPTEVVCSKCHSNQLSTNAKGYNTGAAAIGGLFNANNSVALGMAGSGDLIITCLSCGHKFKPGDGTLKTVSANGTVKYEKQVYIDKEGNRWRNCALVILVLFVLFLLLIWSWIT